MKENDKNNYSNEPLYDLYDLYENTQKQKTFISTNVYSKSKDDKSESN